MSLNFDFTEVQNPPHLDESLTEDQRAAWCRKVDHMLWSCLFTGIGHIKDEAEAKEFFNRYQVYSVHYGDDNYITLDDVKAYIGLRTNVSRESRFKWDARMRKRFNLK